MMEEGYKSDLYATKLGSDEIEELSKRLQRDVRRAVVSCELPALFFKVVPDGKGDE